MDAELEQQDVREYQRQYLDFLDDDVSVTASCSRYGQILECPWFSSRKLLVHYTAPVSFGKPMCGCGRGLGVVRPHAGAVWLGLYLAVILAGT